MRVPLKEYLEKLGVDYILSPYETYPWLHYDDEKGITCSAEVRMGPAHEEVEAELQFLYDRWPFEESEDEGEPEHSEESEGGEEEGAGGMLKPKSNPDIIIRLRGEPVTEDKWTTKALFIRQEDFNNRVYDWEEKGCDFFRACVQAMQMGDLPDIEALMEKELSEDGMFGGGRRGRVGRKSPKIKPAQLLGMKKGGM